jgi:hypothetical protein
LELKYDEPIPNFAFYLNTRPYMSVSEPAPPGEFYGGDEQQMGGGPRPPPMMGGG